MPPTPKIKITKKKWYFENKKTKNEEQDKFQIVIQPAKILNSEELNLQTKKIFEK